MDWRVGLESSFPVHRYLDAESGRHLLLGLISSSALIVLAATITLWITSISRAFRGGSFRMRDRIEFQGYVAAGVRAGRQKPARFPRLQKA